MFNIYNKRKQKYRDSRDTRGDIKKSKLKIGTERVNINKSYTVTMLHFSNFRGLKAIGFTCFREL